MRKYWNWLLKKRELLCIVWNRVLKLTGIRIIKMLRNILRIWLRLSWNFMSCSLWCVRNIKLLSRLFSLSHRVLSKKMHLLINSIKFKKLLMISTKEKFQICISGCLNLMRNLKLFLLKGWNLWFKIGSSSLPATQLQKTNKTIISLMWMSRSSWNWNHRTMSSSWIHLSSMPNLSGSNNSTE